MPNQEILDKLYDEQKLLIKKIKAIRNAIIGFGGEISNEDFDGILEVEEEILSKKPLDIPTEFDPEMLQTQKIGYAIKQLNGEAYVSEIADKLIELEDLQYTDAEKIQFRRRITLLTSYLYRDNRLKVKKDGNRYKYRLIE